MGLSDSKLCGFLLHQTVSRNNINNDNNKRLDPVKSLGEPGCVPKACSQKVGLPPFGLAACPRAVPMPVVSGLSAGFSRLDHPFPFPARLECRVSFLYPHPSSSCHECPFMLPRWGLHSVLFKGKSWSREWSFHSLILLLEISAPLEDLS